MKYLKLVILLFVVISFTECKKDNVSDDYTDETTEIESDDYPDGTYCADVNYYNPDTGTRSTYSLNVEVVNYTITVIHWPSGGWLDESHFTAQGLSISGSCSFTSDKGYQYEIQIKGPECSFTDESKMSSDLEDDKNAVTCPNCGGDKETNEKYCNNCVEFEKNACPQCGDQKSNYNDLCDYCYKKNHTCLMCGKLKDTLSPVKKLCPDCLKILEKYKTR